MLDFKMSEQSLLAVVGVRHSPHEDSRLRPRRQLMTAAIRGFRLGA